MEASAYTHIKMSLCELDLCLKSQQGAVLRPLNQLKSVVQRLAIIQWHTFSDLG